MPMLDTVPESEDSARARHFIALNFHQFHDEDTAFTSAASAMHAATHLKNSQATRVKVVFFYHKDAPPSTAFRNKISELGLPFIHAPVSSNGEGLNLQIERALEMNYHYFYRVDADDFVYKNRFSDQAEMLVTEQADMVGGALLYQVRNSQKNFLVTPVKSPGFFSFCFNQYSLHPTLSFNLQSFEKAGIRYWNNRLEDKALYLAARKAGLTLVNSQNVHGVYNLDPGARNSIELNRINQDLNASFARAINRAWLVPFTWIVFQASRCISAHNLRRLRRWLSTPLQGKTAHKV